MIHRSIRKGILCAWVAAVLPGIFGCPVIVRNERGHVLHREEPVSGQAYEMYVPSTYHPDRAWPLVVTCHGTAPFDNAKLQLSEWRDLAERKGLIVAAPVLKGTKARTDSKPGTVEQQIELQRYDEETILATVNHIRAGYHIDEGRVFLTGWSAGSYAVLWTGLSHPEIFRALAGPAGKLQRQIRGASGAPAEQPAAGDGLLWPGRPASLAGGGMHSLAQRTRPDRVWRRDPGRPSARSGDSPAATSRAFARAIRGWWSAGSPVRPAVP